MKPRMRMWLLPLVALSGLLLAIAWMAGLFTDKIPPGLNTLPASEMRDTSPAVLLTTPNTESIPGTLRAKQATLVSSRILARITEVRVRSGDKVSAGDMLVRLEQADAQARLAQAKDRALAMEARSKEATQALDRALSLHERGLIAIADVDKARANQASYVAELSAARELVTEASTALQFAEIRAPIDGTIVDRFAEPGDTATPGSPLLSIYNPLTVRVEAQVREQLAVNLAIGQELTVYIPSIDQTLPAQIDELVPAADPGSRSFMVKARLSFDQKLRPGMYARLEVPGAPVQRIVVPTSSIARVGQLDVIWVYEEGHFIRRFVKVGKQIEEGQIEILGGVEPGENVLTVAPTAYR